MGRGKREDDDDEQMGQAGLFVVRAQAESPFAAAPPSRSTDRYLQCRKENAGSSKNGRPRIILSTESSVSLDLVTSLMALAKAEAGRVKGSMKAAERTQTRGSLWLASGCHGKAFLFGQTSSCNRADMIGVPQSHTYQSAVKPVLDFPTP